MKSIKRVGEMWANGLTRWETARRQINGVAQDSMFYFFFILRNVWNSLKFVWEKKEINQNIYVYHSQCLGYGTACPVSITFSDSHRRKRYANECGTVCVPVVSRAISCSASFFFSFIKMKISVNMYWNSVGGLNFMICTHSGAIETNYESQRYGLHKQRARWTGQRRPPAIDVVFFEVIALREIWNRVDGWCRPTPGREWRQW